MTLDDTRNAMAEMASFRYHVLASGKDAYWVLNGEPVCNSHPIPASLDWLVKAWPEDVEWNIAYDAETFRRSWAAYRSDSLLVDPMLIRGHDTGDELLDRMTLLLKVAQWLRDNDRPAFDVLMEKWRKLV